MLKCWDCSTWGKCEHEKYMPITEKRSTYKKTKWTCSGLSPMCRGWCLLHVHSIYVTALSCAAYQSRP